MTAPIDIECPACASTAGTYCTSATVDPKQRQQLTFYHAERIDAAFRQLEATQDAQMLAAYIAGANDADDGVKCKRTTFEAWKVREASRLNEIANHGATDLHALRTALHEALERIAKYGSTEILAVPFTRGDLAVTITSLRERFPARSDTADRLERLLSAAQAAPPVQNALSADDLRFILTTREAFKL
jgi:hypothetical protein